MNWLREFIDHIFSIVDFFGITPYAVEIHPGKFGDGQNSIQALSRAINIIHTEYERKYGTKILIFIENRTNQCIQDGNDIDEFWEYFMSEYPHLTHITGIILDIMQFFTSTKKYGLDFKSEFSKIPIDSLMGVHIHGRHNGRRGFAHQVPVADDQLPWEYISKQIKNLGTEKRPLHVLPEVHHVKHVEKTFEFCKNYLSL